MGLSKDQWSEAEIRAIARSELQKMFGPLMVDLLVDGGAQPKVLPLKDAVEPLGYGSYIQLYEDVNRGLFRVGREVEDRRRPGNVRPRYYINLEAARRRLAELPERRKPA